MDDAPIQQYVPIGEAGDVTGERNFARQIAFGVSDRSSLEAFACERPGGLPTINY